MKTALNSRYGDLERRVLKFFAEDPNLESVWINKGFDILLMYLVEDGLLIKDEGLKYYYAEGNPFQLTDKGREFVKRWLNAEVLE
ncbi:MAG TPA: hypothetical protein VJ464_23755 [Blastocatellia bacterium]|nr:hypothetical protein [Blastocatellia bacterium]